MTASETPLPFHVHLKLMPILSSDKRCMQEVATSEAAGSPLKIALEPSVSAPGALIPTTAKTSELARKKTLHTDVV
jgi:hypothetical protein